MVPEGSEPPATGNENKGEDMTKPPTDLGVPLSWEAPGEGQWNLDRSHVNRPATPINQHIQSLSTVRGSRAGFIELGAPLDGLDFRFVNGLVYSRVRPLIAPDKAATKLPPLPLLKLAIKLHPEMRRRRATAERVLSERPWRRVLAQWHAPEGVRASLEAANLAIQEISLVDLSDHDLRAHVHRTIRHALEMWEQHFRLHNHDLGPIGLLLVATVGWGIPTSDVIPLLEGASPSTSEAERTLRRIREAIDVSGSAPTTLEQMRAVSPSVAADIDAFLRLRGRLVFSRYDIDGMTLAESPEMLAATILAARDNTARASEVGRDVAARTAAVRSRVPADKTSEFDMLLDEARTAMDLRDDNGPHTVEWPLGLVRMALLEVGRRMTERGAAHAPVDALELTVDEVDDAVTGAGPGADVLRDRRKWRNEVDIESAPRRLGPEEPPPPLEVLPESMARIVGFVQVVIAEAGLDGEVKTAGLDGVGVGTAAYRGRARLAATPEEALESLEPGDVLVVPCTTPAYNMVLSLAGAVVTAEGGALSHAAVLARELGIPAVVGVPRALHDIPNGSTVEVDPVAGCVRIV